MRIFPPLAALAAWVLLSACSPEQNWRQLSFEGSTLKAQLPCKPDRTTREVPLGGVPVSLSVAGCEAAGAMLALMSASLAPGVDAQAVLAGWQQATLAHVPPAEPPRSEAWRRSAWLPLAAAQRLVQALGEAAPIGQLGQGVGLRELLQRLHLGSDHAQKVVGACGHPRDLVAPPDRDCARPVAAQLDVIQLAAEPGQRAC